MKRVILISGKNSSEFARTQSKVINDRDFGGKAKIQEYYLSEKRNKAIEMGEEGTISIVHDMTKEEIISVVKNLRQGLGLMKGVVIFCTEDKVESFEFSQRTGFNNFSHFSSRDHKLQIEQEIFDKIQEELQKLHKLQFVFPDGVGKETLKTKTAKNKTGDIVADLGNIFSSNTNINHRIKKAIVYLAEQMEK